MDANLELDQIYRDSTHVLDKKKLTGPVHGIHLVRGPNEVILRAATQTTNNNNQIVIMYTQRDILEVNISSFESVAVLRCQHFLLRLRLRKCYWWLLVGQK